MNSRYLPSRSEHWKWDRQILVFKLSCMKKKRLTAFEISCAQP